MRARRALVVALVVAPALVARNPTGALAAGLTGMVSGSATVTGDTAFIVGVCEAHTDPHQTMPRPAWIDVTCNAYSGGPAGAGGAPSPGPSRNLAISGTGLEGGPLDPGPTLGNGIPAAGVGLSMWIGSSPRPAYVCMDAVAVYSLDPPVSETFSTCTRLAA